MSETQQSTPSSDIQLTVSDLAAMKSIIDVASQRGAFKPSEMTVVGQTYTKITAFIEAVQQQTEKDE